MPNLIEERVELARRGQNPYLICRMASGWLVIGDVQPLPGYCLLLADPLVESINALNPADRARYSRDVVSIGDALLSVTDAYRINYETWGNGEPMLHTHIVPRYRSEPDDRRHKPACMTYDWPSARPFNPAQDQPFMDAMRNWLNSHQG